MTHDIRMQKRWHARQHVVGVASAVGGMGTTHDNGDQGTQRLCSGHKAQMLRGRRAGGLRGSLDW
jgi:hypothetical protein